MSLMFPPPMEFDVSVIITMVGTHALQDWVSCHSLTHFTPFKSIWVNCHSLTHFTPFKSIRVNCHSLTRFTPFQSILTTVCQLGMNMTGFGWEYDRPDRNMTDLEHKYDRLDDDVICRLEQSTYSSMDYYR